MFSEHLPLDFSCEITKSIILYLLLVEKMMLRLNMKCIERLVTQADDINTFPILVEILKFFKFHPPENLVVLYFIKHLGRTSINQRVRTLLQIIKGSYRYFNISK